MPDLFAPVAAALARPGRPSSDYDLNGVTPLPEGVRLRPAAVLVALQQGPDGLHLHLTKRSAQLRHHPGQIALPGGKIELNDPSPVWAALREAREEIGLDPANVEVMGTLAPHRTVTGYLVTPVVARVCAPFVLCAEPGEVEEAFCVPFAHFSDPANYRIEGRLWRGQQRRYYVAPWGPYYVWGATARILRSLADRMAE